LLPTHGAAQRGVPNRLERYSGRPRLYASIFHDLRELGINEVYGVSTQDTQYQQEAVNRLHLPFDLLSDEQLKLASALKLPTFKVEGMTLIKRLTLIVHNGVIEHVFYPVFPPDSNAPAIVHWLVERTTGH
jgi:peroxiredoxin